MKWTDIRQHLPHQWLLETTRDGRARRRCLAAAILCAVTLLAPAGAAAQGSGFALQFDGSDDQAILTGFKGVTGTGDRTVEVWLKANVPAITSHFVEWGSDSALGARWTVRAQNPELRCEVNGGGYNGTTALGDDVWHHVAVVFADDGTPNVSDVVLYVDGALETTAGVAQAINTDATTDVHLGGSPIHGRHLLGQLDEVRIWNVARTQLEIQNNMCQELVGNEPGLVAYLRFNEGSGQVAADETSNGHDATLGSTSGSDADDPTWVASAISNSVCTFVPVELQSFTIEGAE